MGHSNNPVSDIREATLFGIDKCRAFLNTSIPSYNVLIFRFVPLHAISVVFSRSHEIDDPIMNDNDEVDFGKYCDFYVAMVRSSTPFSKVRGLKNVQQTFLLLKL